MTGTLPRRPLWQPMRVPCNGEKIVFPEVCMPFVGLHPPLTEARSPKLTVWSYGAAGQRKVGAQAATSAYNKMSKGGRALQRADSFDRSTVPARDRGFTLIELIITVFIIGMLAAVAIPSFRTITLNNARSATVNDMVAAMTFARAEASKRGFPVVVCPAVAGACVPSVSGWNAGWLVYAETTVPREEPPVFDDEDIVLKVYTRTSTSTTISSNAASVVFRSFGGRNTAGTMTFCDSRGVEQAKAVAVQASGKVKTGAAASCA